MLPLLARVTFHGDADVYSWMTVAMGAGAVAGALFVANRSRGQGSFMFVTGLAFGATMCVAALAPIARPASSALLVLVGACQIAFLATCNSLIQLRSDPVMRGRVMAVYIITLIGTTPIGGPLVGWVCQEFGPRWGLAVGGIATIIGVVVFGSAFVRLAGTTRLRRRLWATEVDAIVLGIDGESIPAVIR